MATIKEITDAYNNNPSIKSMIDAALNGNKDEYHEVIVVTDGVHYKFERVTEFKNLTNHNFIDENTYKITHSTMMWGHITDLQTEINGVVRVKTKKIGEREYKE